MKKFYLLITLASTVLVSSFLVANASSKESNLQAELAVDANLSEQEVQNKVDEHNQKVLNSKITFAYKENKVSIKLNQLPVTVKTKVNENSLSRLTNYAAYFTKEKNYQLRTDIKVNDNLALQDKILTSLELPSKVIEPSLAYEAGEFKVIPGQNAYQIINTTELVSSLENYANPINLSIQVKEPNTTQQQLMDNKDKLDSFSQKTITFNYPERLFSESVTFTKEDISISSNDQYYPETTKVDQLLELAKPVLESEREDLIIKSINTETNQAELDGDLINGIKINTTTLLDKIQTALNSDQDSTEIEINTFTDPAKVINQYDDTPYKLIGQGVSNFTGSGEGRKHNVRYASDSRYKSIFIPKDTQFAFNSYLGGPVTLSRGWQTAYVISGGRIVPAPGGGICQMSTTVYRAALNAGLPIDRQDNHSLYVDYYAAYGDGLDATIFPGSKDLVFSNNTPNDIILHSNYNQNNDLFVNIIGIDDGRKIQLNGPYYAGDNETNPFGVTTRTNQINWVRQITNPNGEVTNETLTSTYSRYYRR